MSICKDCLHYEVCHFNFKGCELTEEEKKDCGFFKPKADYVEVVRCKDCAYREEIEGFGYKGIKAKVCVNWFKPVRDNFFCAYGIRKESEVQGE